MHTRKLLLALLIMLNAIVVNGQQIELVMRMGSNSDVFSSTQGHILEYTVMRGKLYFIIQADSGATLYRTDGTGSGTEIVYSWWYKSYCQKLTVYHDKLFFIAGDEEHGVELWTSDGTRDGTYMLKDIFEGNNDGFASPNQSNQFKYYNDQLYFVAADKSSDGELWKTDGTQKGTKKVFEQGTLPGVAISTDLLEVMGGQLFCATATFPYATLLRCYGKFESLSTVTYAWLPSDCINAGNKLFCSIAYHSNDSDHVFDRTGFALIDGTANGFVILDTTITATADYAMLGNTACFIGVDKSNKRALYISDGTKAGTFMIKDSLNIFKRRFRTSDKKMGFPVVLNQKIYFTDKTGLWQSDGTAAGTMLIKKFANADQDYLKSFIGDPYPLMVARGRLYFRANDTNRAELFTSDGTAAGTYKILPPFPCDYNTYDLQAYWLTPFEPMMEYNGQLFFSAAYDASTGNALYKISLPPADTTIYKWSPDLIIFPNPATGSITIRPAAAQNFSQLTIYDAAGRKVWMEALPAFPWREYTVSSQSLAAGVYNIQLSGSSTTVVRPIVILK